MPSTVVALVLISVVAASAQNDISPLVDAIVEEEVPSQLSITRECFQRSCYTALGHSECRMSRMPCEQKAPTEWLLAKPNRLVAAKVARTHGLVDVVQHKHPVNPNGIITMPGIPAKAPPGMLKAMKKQDKLVKKILAMEEREAKMDPLHKKARANWIKLAKTMQHMPPGPVKLKNERLLMQLARNLAVREMQERAQLSKVLKQKQALKKKLKSAAGKALLRKAKRQALKKLGHEAAPEAHHVKTLNGIPVSNRKCYERACIKKMANGSCGAVVITCGTATQKPAHTSKLTPQAAMAKVKRVLTRMGMSRNVMHTAGHTAYAEQMFLQETRPETASEQEFDERDGQLMQRMRENEDIAQEESENLFERSLHDE